MKKKILLTASAAVLTLGMSVTALADVVSSDVDYGTEGVKTDSSTIWNSAANGQFSIEDGQTVTFEFDSQMSDSSIAAFGWVAEVTDGASYFTITQGGTQWYAPAGCEWVSNTNNQMSIERSWTDDEVDAYIAAMADAKVTLVVTRSGNQIIFESTAVGTDGETYTQKAVSVFETAPEGTLTLQVGSDHGTMTLYNVKYSEAGEVEEATTVERKTLKPSLDTSAGLAGSDDEEESPSNVGLIVGIVVAVLVVAVVVGVVVATKKKKTSK